MATRKKRQKATDGLPPTSDYRYGDKRTNIPAAQIAGEGEIPKVKRVKYAYSPHLDPVLRFDPTGRADKVAEVVEKACAGKSLTEEEKEILRAVGKNWQQPWLEWAGKQEQHVRETFSVDPVALHIHERISAQAIVQQAMRKDVEPSLFGSREQSYAESLQFYKHDMDWANRLILGDSLQVMSSLVHRESLAGKVQMIYIDPPYGIKFASNFQPEVGNRDVKDGKAEDLTRDPEMVKAFRDTWHLGVGSYLSYLESRLQLARELLSDTGSIFVQIGDENVHVVRAIMDTVLGRHNFIAQIQMKKSGGATSAFLPGVTDYLCWFAKQRPSMKFRSLYQATGARRDDDYGLVEHAPDQWMTSGQASEAGVSGQPMQLITLTSQRQGRDTSEESAMGYSFPFRGQEFRPSKGRGWTTTRVGMQRLASASRIARSGNNIRLKRYLDDSPGQIVTDFWDDIMAGAGRDKAYVVQTGTNVVERCMLMTTDPGDLILDPTCGSGTAAVVAEQWGRRWITIDASRVALSIARHRLLTVAFDHYRTAGGPQNEMGAENPSSGFRYKTVPRISLGAIAQNAHLDPLCAKHEQILAAKLNGANDAVSGVPTSLRAKLRHKLGAKEKSDGKRSITDADRRRWILPPDNRDPKEKWTVDPKFVGWYEWEVPFDTDPDWPKPLQDAVLAYRKAWRAKMDEVNACIAANAGQEELVDQPEVVKGVVRVSGPFTVEGVIPEELSLTEEGVRDLTPNEFDDPRSDEQNAQAYLDVMVRLMQRDGVMFLGNQKRMFSRVEPLYETGNLSGLHAEAAWDGEDDLKVAIAFGPQYGPVTALQVESLIRASRRYEHLVIAAFSFAPEASAIISASPHPKLQIHMAHIRPDVNPAMQGLLKETPNSQLFTVFGLPAVSVQKDKGGEYTVELEGVDIYDPVENTVRSTKAEKVAAWFLDSDFDGRCFCVTQAFFPHRDAWEKIAKALKTEADLDAFETFKGTVSLPFKPGKHATVAVKVIDPRGNEVMTVKKLEG